MRTNSLIADSLRIHLLESGQGGDALLLLHGNTDSAPRKRGGLIDELTSIGRALAPGLPGYGERSRPAAAYTQLNYLDFVERLMDELGLSKASLMGISMGGSIALGMALCALERVRRLALTDSCGLQSRAPTRRLSYLTSRIPLLIEGS
jgi:pimeloyl-ACP methyl ester carboxylesterase